MSNQQLSWCCFAPVTVDENVWQAADSFNYCSWCGADVDPTDTFTAFHHDTGSRVELVARRFKDGEASYSELKHTIEDDVNANWKVIFDDIGEHYRRGKDGPGWEFDNRYIKWVKARATLPPQPQPKPAEDNDVKDSGGRNR